MMVNEIEGTIPKLGIGDIFYEKGQHEYKYHVVAILDKEDVPQIVFKYYGKRKQWWHYEIKSIYSFNVAFHIGLYRTTKE